MCADRKTITVKGKVVKKLFSKGSKSEHLAFYLQTGKDEWVLRKIGDNPFENNALAGFENKQVVCKGYKEDYVFFAEDVREE